MHNMMKLAPRFQALEDRVNVYSGIIDEPSALGVTLPTVTTPEELRDLRDALLVTAALGLGVSTRDARLQALDRQAGVYCAMELETQNPLNARYSMILGDMSRCILDWTSSMRYFFGYDEHTEYFDDDCEHVKAMIAEFEHDITKFTSIPIDLLVNAPSNWSLSDQIEYVKSIATIVRETMRQTQRAEQTHPLRPRFELKTIDLNFQTLHVTQGVAQQLQKLLALDVAVKSIVLPAQTSVESLEITDWRSAWANMLFMVCGHPLATIRTSQPVQKLYIFRSGLPEVMYQALCSVIMHASTLKTLFLEDRLDPLATTHTRWRWLQYALFSQASTTSIESFQTQNAPLLWPIDDMDVATIVNARFPEGLLLPRSGSNGDTDLGSVLVGPGAMIHSATDPSVTLPVNDPDGYSVSILRDDPASSHLDILVPGFGHGLVERAVCQTTQPQSYSHESGIRSRVRDIWIDDGINTCPGGPSQCALLLPCIGAHLRSLRVSAQGQNAAHLQLILDNCPYLRNLDVMDLNRGYLESLLSALKRPQSGLRSLRLLYWLERDDAALVELLDLLADPSSVAAGQLQRLTINDPSSYSVASSPEIAEALARVVRHYKTLHHIEAFLTEADDITYQDALRASGPPEPLLTRVQCQRLHALGLPLIELGEVEDDAYNRRVPSPSPLPLRVICAFLSIFASDTTARYRPDMLVSATIFRFAGETVVRRVVIEYPTVF